MVRIPFALVALGGAYAALKWRESQIEKRVARIAALELEEAERRRQNALLMDAYGDRSSLEALEQARRVYEEQQRRS